jgi:formylmethanofuran dehydrogenase subunit E
MCSKTHDGPTDDKILVDTEVIIPDKKFIEEKCELCGQQIGISKRKKIQGKIFHKSCFKQQKQKLRLAGKTW